MNDDERLQSWTRRLRDRPLPRGLVDSVVDRVARGDARMPVPVRGWALGCLALLGAAKVASVLLLLLG